MGVFFNGRLWVSPATMSVVDDSAMYNKNLSVGNLLAIVGKSEGGKPATALRFGSASEARAVLRSGEALKAIELAFDPSAQTYGPSTVVFVRVNPATQAALTLLDGSAASVIDLVSEGYGLFTNGIKVKVEAGSVSGKKLTSQFGTSYYSDDNVKRNAFSVVYTGAEATATISISSASVTVQLGSATPVVIDLTAFGTISQVVDRINAISPSLSAIVLDGNYEKATLNGLDYATAQSIKTTLFTVTANLQAVVDWFNSNGEGYVTATRKANVGTVPANLAFTYLAAATDGEVTNVQWQAAFDALQTEDVQWVVPVSPTPAIHAMTDTHCSYMSNIARMERRCIVGGDINETDDFAIAAAKALGSDRASYTHIGFYDYNTVGTLTLYPPYILAGMLAGAFSGVNPGTALTNKTIKVRGLERKLRNPTDTDKLILGGVLCVEDTPKGFKVVKSITTWLVNSNYNRVEISVGVALDFVSRNVRNILDDLRGMKGTPTALAMAVSRVDSTLAKLAEQEPMGPGVIVGDKLNPAYKNITASLEGDVMKVSFQCSPVIPINYIPVAIFAVPYSGSASL
ncbi:hypothetical protein [Propionivibrio sp.]|uniref:hypothetical protein n=1 Tax=Propionivibrio sp. TaxID=2212460 RepID=UPI003BF25F7A